MADRSITQLSSASSASAEDLFLVVDDPNGAPTTKKITTKALFGSVQANAVFSANVTIRGNRALIASNTTFTKALVANTVILPIQAAPASNNATTAGWSVGNILITNTHMYIAVNATSIKRVALSTF